MFAPTPSAAYTRWPATLAACWQVEHSSPMRELSSTSNPRGAYIATSDEVSPGTTFTLVPDVYIWNAVPNQPCASLQADDSDWAGMLFGPFGAVFTMRNADTPPVPDSCRVISGMRSSNAPTVNAALPLREQPVTPTAVGSMMLFRPAAFSSIRTPMTRLMPHAQPICALAPVPVP